MNILVKKLPVSESAESRFPGQEIRGLPLVWEKFTLTNQESAWVEPPEPPIPTLRIGRTVSFQHISRER